MKPTKGPYIAKPASPSNEPTVWEAPIEAQGYITFAYAYGSREQAEADARFIVAAFNACVEINSDNPIAAAETMPEIFRLLNAVVVDARKICGKKLDLEQWLREADAAILKALEVK